MMPTPPLGHLRVTFLGPREDCFTRHIHPNLLHIHHRPQKKVSNSSVTLLFTVISGNRQVYHIVGPIQGTSNTQVSTFHTFLNVE